MEPEEAPNNQIPPTPDSQIEPSVSASPPKNSFLEKLKERRKLILVVGGAVLIVLVLAGGILFYYQKYRNIVSQEKPESYTQPSTLLTPTITKDEEMAPKILSPNEVVTDFLKAIQNKDKLLARTYLSENANREAFKATLEDESTSLLYENEFLFTITQSKLSKNQQVAEVYLDTQIGEETIKTKASLVLEEKIPGEKIWLLIDFVGFYEGELRRTLFLLYGPVDFSMTSPSGESLGFGTKNDRIDLDDVFANYFSSPLFKKIAITDLYGIWRLEITGIDSGTFTLATEIVDRENPQVGKIEDAITAGQVLEYEVSYPFLKGVPIVVSPR